MTFGQKNGINGHNVMMYFRIFILIQIFLYPFITYNGYSEKIFWLKQSNIKEIIKFEKDFKSDFLVKNEMISSYYLPDIDKYELAKPIIARRDNLLPLYTQYYYSKQDSIVRCIIYDFEVGRYENYDKKEKIWKDFLSSVGTKETSVKEKE